MASPVEYRDTVSCLDKPTHCSRSLCHFGSRTCPSRSYNGCHQHGGSNRQDPDRSAATKDRNRLETEDSRPSRYSHQSCGIVDVAPVSPHNHEATWSRGPRNARGTVCWNASAWACGVHSSTPYVMLLDRTGCFNSATASQT